MAESSRRVYLEGRIPGWRLHSLYKSLLTHPPNGYTMFTARQSTPRDDQLLRSFDGHLSGMQSVKSLFDFAKPVAYQAYLTMMRKLVKTPQTDLVYSSQHIPVGDSPWVVDLEFVTGLVAYGRLNGRKKWIEKAFASASCKKILPWTDRAKKTILLSLDCREFEDKIETVRIAVHARRPEKIENDSGNTRLLFVGTGNTFNIHRSFELKGGREMLLAFKRLREKFRNLELTIRSAVPPEYLSFCQRYGVRVLPGVISQSELDHEFRSADIFVFPGHQTPGTVILDAMSYGLPVVASDVWAISEMVADQETGLLTQPSKYANYIDLNDTPLWGEPEFFRSLSRVDPGMVDDIVEKVSCLVDDSGFRARLGANGRKEVEVGKYSIKERNQKLRTIFDDSLDE